MVSNIYLLISIGLAKHSLSCTVLYVVVLVSCELHHFNQHVHILGGKFPVSDSSWQGWHSRKSNH